MFFQVLKTLPSPIRQDFSGFFQFLRTRPPFSAGFFRIFSDFESPALPPRAGNFQDFFQVLKTLPSLLGQCFFQDFLDFEGLPSPLRRIIQDYFRDFFRIFWKTLRFLLGQDIFRFFSGL